MGRIPVSGAEGKDKGPRRDQCHSKKVRTLALMGACKGRCQFVARTVPAHEM